jgi:hypothetical protein
MKINKTIILALLAVAGSLSAQTTFIVDNFSDKYFGKVFVPDTAEVTSAGWVAIFDKKTKRRLIKIEADELSLNLHNGKMLANVKELPYGEQSVIMYEDYNFDGKKDFALMDGQYSCYGGPAFKIYLATDKGFEYSENFTRLAQEYCGMFNVDYSEQRIYTMTKDGCCWHQYSEFVVENNRPVAVKIVEEEFSPNNIMIDYVEKNRINGKMLTKKYSVFNTEEEERNVFYSFEFSNKKKMRLLKEFDRLYYIFTDKDDKIELYHWDDSFYYSKKNNTLEFENGKTIYTITSTGIIVTTPSKKYDMKAVPATIKGSLTYILNNEFENVSVE